MAYRTRRRVAVAAALLVVAVGAALLLWPRGDDAAARSRAAVAAFASAWSRGDDAAAGRLTDSPRAVAALRANRAGLDGAKVEVTPGPLTVKDGRATGRLRIVWRIPAIGRFAYRSPVTAREGKDRWLVHFTPRTVHPALTARTRLGTSAAAPARADILAGDGTPLIKPRRVVRVGLQRDKVTDVAASANALASGLGLAAGPLRKAVRGAGPKQFVEAETLRPGDYATLAPKLAGIPGLLTVRDTAPLAPTREFARALLGGVGLTPGSETGQWGLEKRFDARLAGTPTRRILIRETSDGATVRTLRTLPGRRPRPLRTTLSAPVQEAAEQALAGVDGNAALVALQPSTGDILAVANRPVDDTFDRALGGTYAPGSTFKVITTAALLRHGFDPATSVPCPPTRTVDGRAFKNFEGEANPAATFADDFAESCNTAFVSLADRLPADALEQTARDYGLERPYDLAVGVARTRVPPGTDAVSRAASMIGQAKISVTPLAMAGVAAAVADGRWHRPRLLAGDPTQAGPALPDLATLRGLMRQVVTRGTAATAFAGVPGEVAGKTGTAEFGTADPPETHAWFIAYRGDLAVAVLVEKGSSGGAVAAPLAARFFTSLG